MKKVDEENLPSFLCTSTHVTSVKNPSQPPIVYSIRYPQLKKQTHIVLLLPYRLTVSIESFQHNKNKIEYLFGLVNRLHYCSSRKLTYSERISRSMLLSAKSKKIFFSYHMTTGAAKSKDLEIEDTLLSVFKSLWHLTPASWDAVLSTANTPD